MTETAPIAATDDGGDVMPADPTTSGPFGTAGDRPVNALRGAGVAATAMCLMLEAVRFITYPQLVLWVLAGALLALWPKGRLVLKVAAVGLAVATAVIAFTPVVDWSVHALDVTVAPAEADVIVVLGAGMYCGTGDLDAASLARLTRGLGLWKAGYAPAITVSDADPSIVGAHCRSQGLMTRGFIRSLYGDDGPPTVVLERMRTTRTEAAEVARLQTPRGWRTVMVVTSRTHSRRALDTFRRAGVNAFVVGATEPSFDRELQHPADRFRALGPVVRELAGMIKYRLTS